MKDGWDKFKISSDIFNTHKVIILTGFSLLASGGINLNQMIYGEEKDFLVDSMTDTITILAEDYVAPTNKPEPKIVTVKSNCNSCRSLWLNDIKAAKDELEVKYHK